MLAIRKCLWITLVTFAFCMFHPFQTVAQNPQNPSNASLLQERLDTACRDRNIPAIWAGLFRSERPGEVAVAGIRKSGDPTPAAIDDIIHIGSCTKAMTAVIIGQLCTEGKLRLDTPLREVFSEESHVVDSKWGDVCIRDLLQHRSGAEANVNYERLDQQHSNDVIAARRQLVLDICARKRSSKPSFVYSNVGYIILGHIAERIEGKSWEHLVSQRIFLPLGMTSAHFGPVASPDGVSPAGAILENRAWGHTESLSIASIITKIAGGTDPPKLEPVNIDNSPCLGPAGRVHVSLQDWSKFVIPFATADGYRSLGLSQDVWNEIRTPAENMTDDSRYAAGWIVFDRPEYHGTAYFHNGSNTTWYCYALVVPGKGHCILVATNVYSASAMQTCDEVARFLNQME